MINKFAFKNICIDDVVYNVFRTTKFPVLKLHMEDEICEYQGNLICEFKNNKDLSDNIYVNDDYTKYQWISVIYNNDIVALQLIHFLEDNNIELIILEKIHNHNINNVFDSVLNYVEKTYKPNEIYTFPLHDKLKETYIKCGFIEKNNELVKYL